MARRNSIRTIGVAAWIIALMSVLGTAVSCTKESFIIDDPAINSGGSILMLQGDVYVINCSHEQGQAKWSSSDQGVADVINGVIFAYNPGTAKITVDPKHGKAISFNVIVKGIPVREFTIDDKIEMYAGNSVYLEVRGIVPENATATSISWSSSDESVLTVTTEGGSVRLNGLSQGTARLTGTSEGVSHSSTVTVKGPDKVNLPASLDAYVDHEVEVTAVQEPEVYSDYNWSIRQDSNVCTVRSEGAKAVLTGIAPGKCTLELSLGGGAVRKSCEVTVKDGSLVIDKSELTFFTGDEITLTATQFPQNYSDYVWESDDESIATVSGNGSSAVVRGGSASGETVVRCYVNGKRISASCRVNTIGPSIMADLTFLLVRPGKNNTYLSSMLYVSPAHNGDVELRVVDMYGQDLPEVFKGRVQWSFGTPSDDSFSTFINYSYPGYNEFDIEFSTPVGSQTITYVHGYKSVEVRPFEYVECTIFPERGWYKGPQYTDYYLQYRLNALKYLPYSVGSFYPNTWQTWTGSVKPGDDLVLTGIDDFGEPVHLYGLSSSNLKFSDDAEGLSIVTRDVEVSYPGNGVRRTWTGRFGHVSETITSSKIINGKLNVRGQEFIVRCQVKP